MVPGGPPSYMWEIHSRHIEPFTELAISLAATNPAVEATVAVTPANVWIVQSSLLEREQQHQHNPSNVKIATYPFPSVDGLPEGVENMGRAATPEQTQRIVAAATSELATRPAQETLIRAQSPDAVVTDWMFPWISGVADELGVPCVAFNVIGAFPMLASRHLAGGVGNKDDDVVEVPRFPGPPIRIPRTELPEWFRRQDSSARDSINSLQAGCFGLAVNTWTELERPYFEMYEREGYVKRAYFIGPLALLRSPSPSTTSPPKAAEKKQDGRIMEWLDTKQDRSVVYVSFGTTAHVRDAQLDELAVGLETSGEPFVWVVRGEEERRWSPPEGWEERVRERGLLVRTWAPQTAILGHPAAGAFVMQCGWNSVLETVAAGVPVLTWPVVYEQFITERLLTQVLGIGERLWPDGAGLRSECLEEHEVVPARDVARALTAFMRPGGPADAARIKVKELAAEARAAVAQGGSSHRDLHRLVDDLLLAAAKRRAALAS